MEENRRSRYVLNEFLFLVSTKMGALPARSRRKLQVGLAGTVLFILLALVSLAIVKRLTLCTCSIRTLDGVQVLPLFSGIRDLPSERGALHCGTVPCSVLLIHLRSRLLAISDVSFSISTVVSASFEACLVNMTKRGKNQSPSLFPDHYLAISGTSSAGASGRAV